MSEEKFDFGNKPTSNWKWFFPPIILLVLHELGGSARWREVVQGLIGRLDPSEEVLQKTGKNDKSVFIDTARFARLNLYHAGYLDKSTDNVWMLSERGKEKIKELIEKHKEEIRKYVQEDLNELDKFRDEIKERAEEHNKEIKKEKQDREEKPDDEEIIEREKKEQIEKIWKILEPTAFETLCMQLFKAVGYKDVEVTKRSNDGGIDGFGFHVFGLVRFRVVFQAKRYENDYKVGAPIISRLYGDMEAHKYKVEKAVLITTSDFTSGAREKALELGIELINGERLIDLLRKYKIGYSKENEFNEDFFSGL